MHLFAMRCNCLIPVQILMMEVHISESAKVFVSFCPCLKTQHKRFICQYATLKGCFTGNEYILKPCAFGYQQVMEKRGVQYLLQEQLLLPARWAIPHLFKSIESAILRNQDIFYYFTCIISEYRAIFISSNVINQFNLLDVKLNI